MAAGLLGSGAIVIAVATPVYGTFLVFDEGCDETFSLVFVEGDDAEDSAKEWADSTTRSRGVLRTGVR